jgi:hypothetical protein
MLGITLIFWADWLGTAFSCQAHLGCRPPSLLTPVQWIAWVGAAGSAILSISSAAREAQTGERRRRARIAILITVICGAVVLTTVLWNHGPPQAD